MKSFLLSALVLYAAVLILTGEIVCQTVFTSPVVNEFLPDPAGDLETEWIELYNPLDHDVDLQNYVIGDELGWRSISDSSLVLPAEEYLILAQDKARFLEFYSDFEGTVTCPVGWQVLNNNGDIVRLGDEFQVTLDSVEYDKGFYDNRSWERYIAPSGESFWGGSFNSSGSTPGKPNSYFYPRSEIIDLDINPDPFSPDGDGFEDIAIIRFNPPAATSLSLVIYDIAGRKVKRLLREEVSIPGEITWDGHDDYGRRLPVGIYIVYANVEGTINLEVKRTVVIAR